MFGYEQFAMFKNVERRVTYRAIRIAIRRAKLYTKPSVLLKETALFSLLASLIFIVFFKVETQVFELAKESLSLLLIMLWSPISVYILKSEFNEFVLPLLPKALADAQRFPTMVK